MDECQITGLRLGNAELDLQLMRRGDDVALHVTRRTGAVDGKAVLTGLRLEFVAM